jgi:hypothetical protein
MVHLPNSTKQTCTQISQLHWIGLSFSVQDFWNSVNLYSKQFNWAFNQSMQGVGNIHSWFTLLPFRRVWRWQFLLSPLVFPSLTFFSVSFPITHLPSLSFPLSLSLSYGLYPLVTIFYSVCLYTPLSQICFQPVYFCLFISFLSSSLSILISTEIWMTAHFLLDRCAN